VARVIVRAIRNGDPPGRFIKKNESTGKWYDVGDKKAAEKTSQALREKTYEERDQHKTEAVTLGSAVFLPSPLQEFDMTQLALKISSLHAMESQQGGVSKMSVSPPTLKSEVFIAVPNPVATQGGATVGESSASSAVGVNPDSKIDISASGHHAVESTSLSEDLPNYEVGVLTSTMNAATCSDEAADKVNISVECQEAKEEEIVVGHCESI
jgi:hypothetical protein